MNQAPHTGHAPVNGLDLYYEIHGSGKPLVLLHGGFGLVGMFAPILSALASDRQVIGVDLQAHGHTADIDRPMRWDSLSDDVAGLIAHLGLGKADVMGYSLGGGTALRTAIRHPEVVDRLVLVSTPFRHDGWYPEMVTGMRSVNAAVAEGMKQTPMYEAYAAAAPRPEDWPRLGDRIGELLRQDYDWSEQVAALQPQTLLVYGDNDGIPPSHAAAFFELLGGGKKDAGWMGENMSRARLAILPGLTHYNVYLAPELAAAVDGFLRSEPAS